MHVLVTGVAGMIGRKLTERLVRDGTLGGQTIGALTLLDVPSGELGFTPETSFDEIVRIHIEDELGGRFVG